MLEEVRQGRLDCFGLIHRTCDLAESITICIVGSWQASNIRADKELLRAAAFQSFLMGPLGNGIL